MGAPMRLKLLLSSACLCLVVAAASCGQNNPPQCLQTSHACVPLPAAATDGGTEAGDSGTDGGQGTLCGSAVCQGDAPICDNSAESRCVRCNESKGCKGIAPICDVTVDGGTCIECTRNEDCPVSAPFCDAANRLCMSADGGRPHAVDGGGEPETDGGDDGGLFDGGSDDGGVPDGGPSPDAGMQGDGGSADGGAPSGEDCASPIPILLDGGAASFAIDLSTATNDTNGSGLCAMTPGQNGPDLIFSLTLTATKAVNITATPTGANPPDVVLYVRGSPCATGSQLACSDNPFVADAPETASFPNLAAGTYFIVVDSFKNATGTADLSISVTP